jgi:hypothetical protein
MSEIEKISTTVRNDPSNIDLYLERGILFFKEGFVNEGLSDLIYYRSLGGDDPSVCQYLQPSTVNADKKEIAEDTASAKKGRFSLFRRK